MAESLLRIASVIERTGMSRSGIYAGMIAGTFPLARKRRSTPLWLASEIDAWIEDRDDPLPDIPERTCLYRHYDGSDRLLYVGISLSAVQRLSQHKAGAAWHGQIEKITMEWFPDRPKAMAAEASAIRNESPVHNIAGRVNL